MQSPPMISTSFRSREGKEDDWVLPLTRNAVKSPGNDPPVELNQPPKP